MSLLSIAAGLALGAAVLPKAAAPVGPLLDLSPRPLFTPVPASEGLVVEYGVEQAGALGSAAAGTQLLDHPEFYTVYGAVGPLRNVGANQMGQALARTSEAGATGLISGLTIAFTVEGNWVGLELGSSSSTKYGLRYIDHETGAAHRIDDGTGIGMAAFNVLGVGFGRPGVRTIYVDVPLDGTFRGVRLGRGTSLVPRLQKLTERVAVVTDSHGITQSPIAASAGTWAFSAMRAAYPWIDFVGFPSGGSGYAAGAGFEFGHEYRIDDVLASGATSLLVAGGANDITLVGTTAEAFGADVRRTVEAYRREGFSGPIVLSHPHTGRLLAPMGRGTATTDASTQMYHDYISSLERVARDLGCSVAPLLEYDVQGTGDTATITRTYAFSEGTESIDLAGIRGSSGLIIGEDDVHHTAYGAVKYGRRLAAEYVNARYGTPKPLFIEYVPVDA